MRRFLFCSFCVHLSIAAPARGQNFGATLPEAAVKSEITEFSLPAVRIVARSASGIENAEALLGRSDGQAKLNEPRPSCRLAPGSWVVLDFGSEIVGGIELVTPISDSKEMPQVRVRFGESVAETMVELEERGAQNDHALRDQTVPLAWLGKTQVGPSGFRFVRLDAADAEIPVALAQVRAVARLRDVPYLGRFDSPDERLNEIWRVGARTVHLNMQEYLWDGIKRDRLVWVGDMHPEIAVIHAVFGDNPVVPKSLDFIRDITPVEEWMNGISAYSMWWVILQEDQFMHRGNFEYLESQKTYLQPLLRKLLAAIDGESSEELTGMRFLDWPTFENPVAVHEGLQALLTLSLDSGSRLMERLGDAELAKECADGVARLRQHDPAPSGRKSPAALLALAGIRDAETVAREVLAADGPADLSTFYGYYVIQALAEGGEVVTALDFIREYWGGMLDFGATTFWEDFDLAWTKNASRIDELVPEGKDDLHGDFGAHCYIGFRHSLCHGWAGGPTAFLSQTVLGITPAAPGSSKVRIHPDLGDLPWAAGDYPTPHGIIHVRHERQPDGSVHSEIVLPEGVERVD